MLWEYYLCSCIDSLIGTECSHFPSMQYLKTGVFACAFDDAWVKKLRVYNTQEDQLSLRGIKLYSGKDEIDGQSLPLYSCTSGAQYKEKPFSFQLCKAAGSSMFCTKTGLENNWMEVEFKKPVLLSKIVLYGRTGETVYARSNCLALDIFDEQGIKQTVYDYQKEIIAAAATLPAKLLPNPSIFRFSQEQIQLVCRILLAARNDSFGETRNLLQELDGMEFSSSAVKKYINECVLKGKKKQFTMKFGCKFTYNLWTQEEKSNYLDACLQVIELLKPHFDKVFFGYGSLLGFVREPEHFIPHDDDLDIVVVGPKATYKDKKTMCEKVRMLLSRNGVEIVKAGGSFCHVKYNNSRRFDVFIRLEDEDGKIYISPRLPDVYLTADECWPTIPIDIMGRSCPVPRNPFAFLDKVYGKDWRIPQDRKISRNVRNSKSIAVGYDENALLDEGIQAIALNEEFYRRMVLEEASASAAETNDGRGQESDGRRNKPPQRSPGFSGMFKNLLKK